MPKDEKAVDTGVDVQIISGAAAGGSVNIPTATQNGNGVVVLPLSQIGAMSQPSPSGPAVIVITVGKKDEEKKKSSSVFQRL